MSRTFAGFGLGPIQTGLFLCEAQASGNFSRYVVAEVDERLVSAVRAAGGRCVLNVARARSIDVVTLEGLEVFNPRVEADRRALVAAVACADEMATALPSVAFYESGDECSVAAILAEGLARRSDEKPVAIYTAENHKQAAQILAGAIGRRNPRAMRNVQTVNTVIGKMSGVITDPEMISRVGLKTLAPDMPRAVLVEEFNRILIDSIVLPGFRRGIGVFIEKDDLRPFAEAKLYGHNAVHAVLGYLAHVRGLTTMAEAGLCAPIMRIARSALEDESGRALCLKYGAAGERLFTPAGWKEYADDLLSRMVRPTLNDLVSRVTRDHVRKLGYDDRLFGAMRLALEQGITPVHLAKGAAAAVMSLVAAGSPVPDLPVPASVDDLSPGRLRQLLRAIWGDRADAAADTLADLTSDALESLRRNEDSLSGG